MKHTLTSKVAELMRKNGRHRRWRRAFSGMAAVVVFITTYMLILPAITMENKAICGMAEHTHTDACYEMQLVCTQEETSEGADVHVHGPECYEQQQVLTCTKQEGEGHAHTDACYGYVCGQEESSGHTHTDACYTEVTHRELTCTEPESAGHSHGDGCYGADGNLVCTEPESTGHTHGDSCYTETVTRELTCGQEESSGHTHTDACIGLICGQEAYEGHTHTDACYTTEDVLVCTEPTGHTHGDGCYEKVLVCDVPEHTHTEACYPAAEPEEPQEPELICTLPEHSHEDACYDADGNLICGLEEHTHTEECYAPVEIPEEETPTTAFPQEIPEGYVEYTFDNEAGLTVTAYAPEGAFGQDVQLFAEVLPEDSKEYAQAKENLDKAENAPEYTGMAAMDIRFVDAAAEDPAQAEEIEPDAEMGQVFVKIDAQALIPEDVDESTLAVQHHAKVSDGGIFGTGILEHTDVVVETVADNTEETGDITATPGEIALPETLPALADEPEMAEAATLEEPAAENETEEPQPAAMNVEAEFAVNSFSTFTITWGTAEESTITVHYVTERGDPLTGAQSMSVSLDDGSESTLDSYKENIDSNTCSKMLINVSFDEEKDGYGIVTSKYIRGTSIYSIKYDNGNLKYKSERYSSWTNWPANASKDVYLVYTITNFKPIETVDTKDLIEINLFDYNGTYNANKTLANNSRGGYTDDYYYGVNANGKLKFTDGSKAWDSGYTANTALNRWTSSSAPLTGIVQDKLEDGYPVLSRQYDGTSLDYLFKAGNNNVKAYTKLNHLFKMEDGYYVFDSSENYARYTGGTDFTVYNQPKDIIEEAVQAGGAYFMPFNDYWTSGEARRNFHFGMSISFSFFMPEKGKVNSEDMVFEFNGDDDVWVFIDGTLALDLGGIHDAASGTINFNTGAITVNGATQSQNLWQLLGVNKFSDYSEHTFNFYYLERGQGASNCAIKFNMPPVPSNALWVGKKLTVPEDASESLQDYMNNLEFSYKVYKSDGNLLVTEGMTYDIYNSKMEKVGTGTVDADGIFTVKPGQYAVFPELCPVNANYTYYVEELITDEFNGQYLGVDYTITGDGGDSTSITGVDSSTSGFVGYKTGALNPADEQNRVVFQNEVNVESLSTLDITKTLTGGDPLNEKFIFEVKTGDELLPVGTSYQVLRSGGDWNTTGDVTTKSISEQDGAGHITLKAGETARLLVLSGTTYSVEEVNTETNWIVTYSQTLDNVVCGDEDNSAAGIQGTVSALDCSVVVTVHNELPVIYGSLSLQKLVDYMGNEGYTTDDTFTFYLSYNGLVEGTQFPVTYAMPDESSQTGTLTPKKVIEENREKIVLVVTLKQNQKATIDNLPTDAVVTITEPNHDGYSVKWKVGEAEQDTPYAKATITAGTTIAVTCTNTTGAVLPSTGGMGTTPFLALGTLLTFGAGMLLVQRRRKEGSDAV